jgi:hypothetical protein
VVAEEPLGRQVGVAAVRLQAVAVDREALRPGGADLAQVVAVAAARRLRRVRQRRGAVGEEVGDLELVLLEELEDRVDLLQEGRQLAERRLEPADDLAGGRQPGPARLDERVEVAEEAAQVR